MNWDSEVEAQKYDDLMAIHQYVLNHDETGMMVLIKEQYNPYLHNFMWDYKVFLERVGLAVKRQYHHFYWVSFKVVQLGLGE